MLNIWETLSGFRYVDQIDISKKYVEKPIKFRHILKNQFTLNDLLKAFFDLIPKPKGFFLDLGLVKSEQAPVFQDDLAVDDHCPDVPGTCRVNERGIDIIIWDLMKPV